MEIRLQIVSSIFGKTGLLNSESRISYLERGSEIFGKFGHVGGKYLTDKMLPTLKIFLQSEENKIIPPN